jgi:hypothetical protein
MVGGAIIIKRILWHSGATIHDLSGTLMLNRCCSARKLSRASAFRRASCSSVSGLLLYPLRRCAAIAASFMPVKLPLSRAIYVIYIGSRHLVA